LTTTGIITLVQLFFAVVIGLYFWNLLQQQQGSKVAVKRESRKELEQLAHARSISLSEPLTERTRPASLSEIVGQEGGIKALRAALCGPNPQHVIIYGPPGVGKTAAARLLLEEAKKNPQSPFRQDARFIELDATTARFDERGIADPLIGSVHDPIYQGAGPLGIAGIPQPKPGAVTKAHGGILFIDEIGELHPTQMNKLLKVLEDRKVFLESAYYNAEDANIPSHVRDIFENGLPADFRMVGATTRMPEEIPPAIRSRCMEVYFRPLLPHEVKEIALKAAEKLQYPMNPGAADVIARYALNGRDGVNIVQTAAAVAQSQNKTRIDREDVEWVINSGHYPPRPDRKIPPAPQVGVVNGLALLGPSMGTLLELEATVAAGQGHLIVTGVIDEEEFGGAGRTVKRRQSTAKASVENVLTALRHYLDVNPREYDIHVNFTGGIPVDGPSAGTAMAAAIYSAFTGIPVDNRTAMTGEVSIRGYVRPVGGVVVKVEAARTAGARRVIIPQDNWQESFRRHRDVEIVPVETLGDLLRECLLLPEGYEIARRDPAPAAKGSQEEAGRSRGMEWGAYRLRAGERASP